MPPSFWITSELTFMPSFPLTIIRNQYLLLTEFEVRTPSYPARFVTLRLTALVRGPCIEFQLRGFLIIIMMATDFCNKKISNERINVWLNIGSTFVQQWIVTKSTIAANPSLLTVHSIIFIYSEFRPKMWPKFPQNETSTKANFIISDHIIRPGLHAAFLNLTILRFPNCGHFWKCLEYLLVWVK